MKIVCISDTHCQISKVILPEGDVLVHSGDLTYRGSTHEIANELKSLKKQATNFKNVIITAGNHDWLAEKDPTMMKTLCGDNGITYLLDSSVEIDGKVFYGSPWQPEFFNWAFNVPRGPELAAIWKKIPDKVDVLLTHGPPAGILDLCPDGSRVGCEDLYKRVIEVKPELHVFGHIHHSYGMHLFNGTTFVNASICTEQYRPTNKPVVVEL